MYGVAKGVGPALQGIQKSPDGNGAGVYAECWNNGHGVHAVQANSDSTGAALYAEHRGANKFAGFFHGNVFVTGDISFQGLDCAEEFAIVDDAGVEPGMVMIMGDNGLLEPSASAYDSKVIGVVAGAGSYRPGIVLGKNQHGTKPCQAIALVGRAFCQADATPAPIKVGDLLTSSTIPGHAMKSRDRARSFGAVIGKALAPLERGHGIVPILISPQ